MKTILFNYISRDGGYILNVYNDACRMYYPTKPYSRDISIEVCIKIKGLKVYDLNILDRNISDVYILKEVKESLRLGYITERLKNLIQISWPDNKGLVKKDISLVFTIHRKYFNKRVPNINSLFRFLKRIQIQEVNSNPSDPVKSEKIKDLSGNVLQIDFNRILKRDLIKYLTDNLDYIFKNLLQSNNLNIYSLVSYQLDLALLYISMKNIKTTKGN